MTGHDRVRELIPLHALDALEGGELAEVERHLESCEACARDLELKVSLAAELVPDGEPPVAVWDRIESEVGRTAPGS